MFGGPLALTSANLSSQASSLSVEVRIGPSRLNYCFLRTSKADAALELPGRNLGLWFSSENATYLAWFRGGHPSEGVLKGAGGAYL